MARNYRQSDYAKNKYSSNIVYAGSDETIEITLEQFLEENPGMTEEDFNFWKNWSDEDYYITDRKDTNEAKHNVSIPSIEANELVSIPSAEEIAIEKLSRESERVYTMKDAEIVLSKFSDAQRRRFLLHEVHGLTTREIAVIEGVSQKAVFDSIEWAKKKLKKLKRTF